MKDLKDVQIYVNAQSSICITSNKVIYFDPYLVKESRNDADYIFITHPHRDHFSPKDIAKVIKNDTKIIYPKSIAGVVKAAGLNINSIMEVVPGKFYEIDEIKFETIVAYNNFKPLHLKSKGWVGYIITIDGIRIFVCGDSDANKYNENVNCDIALIPIGGLATMNPKAAAKLVNQINPKVAIPIHYGTIIGKPENGEVFKKLVNSSIKVELKLFSKK